MSRIARNDRHCSTHQLKKLRADNQLARWRKIIFLISAHPSMTLLLSKLNELIPGILNSSNTSGKFRTYPVKFQHI
jgi:hypothetical protein